MLFKSKQQKEFEKRMVIKKTVKDMNAQIAKLTEAEKTYINLAKKAKQEGLKTQYSLALSGLRSTVAQKKRVQEMLLNFEIMNQSKDIALMTSEFLKGMGSLSKDMAKLCNEKQFNVVSKQFNKAMIASTMAEERMEDFLDNSQDAFNNMSHQQAGTTASEDGELEGIIDAELSADEGMEDIDAQIAAIEKRLAGKVGE